MVKSDRSSVDLSVEAEELQRKMQSSEEQGGKKAIMKPKNVRRALSNIGMKREMVALLPKRAVVVRKKCCGAINSPKAKAKAQVELPSKSKSNNNVNVNVKEGEDNIVDDKVIVIVNVNDGDGDGEDNIVDDIHHFYRELQKHSRISNYMPCQSEINERMRAILINWFVKMDLMADTLFLAVNLMDRFLCKYIVKASYLQLVGVTSILLASKYEDMQAASLTVSDCVAMSRNAYTREQVVCMEKLMLQMLQFNLTAPTAAIFLKTYLRVCSGDTKLEHMAFYLIELSLLHYESSINWEPSLLAAAAIYTARYTLQRMPAWTRQLQNHARYQETDLQPCATMILTFHHLADKTDFKSVYNKYSHPNFDCVAKLPPHNHNQ